MRLVAGVGRLVVRNCDLLIGIWDGAPGKGRGGTADTIRHAALSGPPTMQLYILRPSVMAAAGARMRWQLTISMPDCVGSLDTPLASVVDCGVFSTTC